MGGGGAAVTTLTAWGLHPSRDHEDENSVVERGGGEESRTQARQLIGSLTCPPPVNLTGMLWRCCIIRSQKSEDPLMFLIKLIKNNPRRRRKSHLSSFDVGNIYHIREGGGACGQLAPNWAEYQKKQPTEDFFLLCLLMFLRCLHQNLHQMDQLKQMV